MKTSKKKATNTQYFGSRAIAAEKKEKEINSDNTSSRNDTIPVLSQASFHDSMPLVSDTATCWTRLNITACHSVRWISDRTANTIGWSKDRREENRQRTWVRRTLSGASTTAGSHFVQSRCSNAYARTQRTDCTPNAECQNDERTKDERISQQTYLIVLGRALFIEKQTNKTKQHKTKDILLHRIITTKSHTNTSMNAASSTIS